MADLALIVGLGNPGREYGHTRHNAGFMVVEHLAGRGRVAWTVEKKFNARLGGAGSGATRTLLCLPQTYMNASGEAVAAVMDFYKLAPARLLVVMDDADLPLGELRLRPQGGTGGHHGLESIQQHLGTPEFARLRVGIGRDDPAQREITDYVLAKFRPDEREWLEKILDRACDQVECWRRDGIAKAMNVFNGIITIEQR